MQNRGDGMNIKPEEITSIIKKEIQRYGAQIQTIDSGTIIQIGDGIAYLVWH